MAALGRYDNNEFEEALNEFGKIGDTSKILFNMGVIHATLGEHEKAVCIPLQTIQFDNTNSLPRLRATNEPFDLTSTSPLPTSSKASRISSSATLKKPSPTSTTHSFTSVAMP